MLVGGQSLIKAEVLPVLSETPQMTMMSYNFNCSDIEYLTTLVITRVIGIIQGC